MTLDERLGLEPARDRVISIVGSGGKTTLLYLLAECFARRGLAVAVATTTHILHPADYPVCTGGRPPLAPGKILVCGTPAARDKLTVPDAVLLDSLLSRADILLVEADGSRGLPVKLPNDTEPVLLPDTGRVLVVAGLSALGRPLGEVCHRAELARERLGLTPDQTVTPKRMAALIRCGYGGLRDAGLLLNQADTPVLEQKAEEISARLGGDGFGRITITALRRPTGRGKPNDADFN